MVNSPVPIACKLFSSNFINERTLRDVVTTEGTTNDSKAHQLTRESFQYITIHREPEDKLKELLKILEEEEPAASVVAKEIRKVRITHKHTHTHTHTLSLSLSLSLTL